MNSDLRDLYQDVVLDHGRKPRNFRKVDDANRSAQGVNPLCGDQITLFAKVSNGVIQDLGFQGSGCAISKASASLMTAALKGKTIVEAEQLFQQFHTMVTKGPEQVDADRLGKLAALSGVYEFPVRVKCASLAWHTLKAALAGDAQKPVSTE